MGGGRFLAHWGKQTLAQARALDTLRLLGLSHEQHLQRTYARSETFYETAGEKLITIGRKAGEQATQFFPDIAEVKHVPSGKIWLPLKRAFTNAFSHKGQVVVFVD